jgi:Gpi18-like mannosyltransferase
MLGLVLEVVYVAALIVPFSLLRWISEPGKDLGSITGGTPQSALAFVAASLGLCLLSWLAYRSALVADARASTIVVFAFAVLFAFTMIWIYPIDALDVFDYAMQGRILGVYGDNPYVNLPAQYPGDPFLPSVGWKQFPSVYGPAWLYVVALIARVAGDSQLVAVVGLKCVAAASSLVCTWSVFKVVQRYTPVRAPAAAVLFGWNPLVVLMVGSGHNDALMMALVLTGLVFAESQRRGLGLWLMGLSLAVKLATLPILPALAMGQVRKRATYAELAAASGMVAARSCASSNNSSTPRRWASSKSCGFKVAAAMRRRTPSRPRDMCFCLRSWSTRCGAPVADRRRRYARCMTRCSGSSSSL